VRAARAFDQALAGDDFDLGRYFGPPGSPGYDSERAYFAALKVLSDAGR
jgi:hypothetical protein